MAWHMTSYIALTNHWHLTFVTCTTWNLTNEFGNSTSILRILSMYIYHNLERKMVTLFCENHSNHRIANDLLTNDLLTIHHRWFVFVFMSYHNMAFIGQCQSCAHVHVVGQPIMYCGFKTTYLCCGFSSFRYSPPCSCYCGPCTTFGHADHILP